METQAQLTTPDTRLGLNRKPAKIPRELSFTVQLVRESRSQPITARGGIVKVVAGGIKRSWIRTERLGSAAIVVENEGTLAPLPPCAGKCTRKDTRMCAQR